jgi:hypothetical protein
MAPIQAPFFCLIHCAVIPETHPDIAHVVIAGTLRVSKKTALKLFLTPLHCSGAPLHSNCASFDLF